MRVKNKTLIFVFGAFLLLLGAFLISLMTGTYKLSLSEMLQTFLGQGTKMQHMVIFGLRLPRILTAAFVGAALSTSGCILQSITKNQLAEPGIIGMNAGSALGVVLLIASKSSNYYDTLGLGTVLLMPFAAIVGALFATLLIYGLSYKKGINPTRLILIGIGVNAGINALITMYQLNMSKGDFNKALTWISGSLWGSSWQFFMISAPIVVLFMGLTLYKSKVLDAMDLGDELAVGLGVRVEQERRILLFLAVGLAAAATAVAGNIAFLGLLGPHIAKRLIGPVHCRQIPLAALINGIIIILADTVSRNLFAPLEIPVGITIAAIGVPYFIYLMIKEK
ncbi:FecCD family ABC transporter permease [Cellulosilyticum sp. I15G10I2]|uniref:FecCD family ABC transporter permease n=1 Tax=Cellulosilyticum sp. I15G10I2 TaxID=1892843 RepID=UPI00085C7807|nr:iron ABC transporter permease [Cellulosilyticum sp. I15G10I2]